MSNGKKLVIVLDTNILLVSVKYHWLYQALLNDKYQLAITADILLEYEEKMGHIGTVKLR